MSRPGIIKSKQLKSKYLKNRQKEENDELVYIELDTKCSCPQSTSNDDDASIQFARRYLQCQSSMPIRILRLFIETLLSHSPMTKVSMFDANDRLLKDSDRLSSLKHTCSPSSHHILIRFTLINTITSFGHCSCSSPSIEYKSSPSSSPTIIELETIDQILSTCSFIRPTPISPCLSSSPLSNRSPSPMGVANLLTPPSFINDSDLNESMIDQITSEFGEICPPLSKSKRCCIPKKLVQKPSLDIPLDLSIKKRSLSTFELFSLQRKWIKT